MITERDDYPHSVPPQALRQWKENWVFSSVDTDNRVAVLFHFSLRPQQAEGVYTAKLAIDGLQHRYVGRGPVPAELNELWPVANERLRLDIEEPLRRFRVRFVGDALDADVMYTGRFEPWDFADGVKAPGRSTLGEIGRSVLPFHHYEQAVEFAGTITYKGGDRAWERLRISGWGNRDHSWGPRDDHQFLSHHWVCASFNDRFVQGTVMQERSYPDAKHGGFVSTRMGNRPVGFVNVADSYWNESNRPFPEFDRAVRYRVETVDARVYSVVAHIDQAYAKLYLNYRSKDRSQAYQDCQIFCDYTLEETGQQGCGVLEVGKRLEGPGVGDRI